MSPPPSGALVSLSSVSPNPGDFAVMQAAIRAMAASIVASRADVAVIGGGIRAIEGEFALIGSSIGVIGSTMVVFDGTRGVRERWMRSVRGYRRRITPMNVLPDRDHQIIEFCSLHQPVWAEHADRLRLDPEHLEALGAQAVAAREAFQAAQAAREAAKAATMTLNAVLAELRATAAACVKTIKASAGSDEAPSEVYALAQIPEPARPSPLGAPGAAQRIAINLVSGGAGGVKITWTARDASRSTGAVFEVLRRVGASAMLVVGVAQGGPRGRFSFVDDRVPEGAGSGDTPLAYALRPRRGNVVGSTSPVMVVSLGSAGGGSASVGGGAMKIAA
jgi:hypothetical protein